MCHLGSNTFSMENTKFCKIVILHFKHVATDACHSQYRNVLYTVQNDVDKFFVLRNISAFTALKWTIVML